MRPLARRPLLALLLVGALAGVLARAALALPLVRAWEHAAVDARFAVRGERPWTAPIVLVEIDDETLARYPQLPLPRRTLARALVKIRSADPSVLALDLALQDPGTDAEDAELLNALNSFDRAVVSVVTLDARGDPLPLVGRLPYRDVEIRPGTTLLRLDGDASVRRFPTAVGSSQPFALVAAQLRDPSVRPRSGALIDYTGGQGSVRRISFADVLSSKAPIAALRDAIVVIGPTEPLVGELRRTPLSQTVPGSEIHAQAIATALAGFPLRTLSGVVSTAICLALGLATGLCIYGFAVAPRRRWPRHRLSSRALGSAAFAIAFGWALIAQAAFDRGAVVPAVGGWLVVLLAALASTPVVRARRRLEFQRARTLFAENGAGNTEILARGATRDGVLTADQVIAGYTLRTLLATSDGLTYEATQHSVDRPVVVKILHPTEVEDVETRARFAREVRLAATVQHPNAIAMLDAGEDRELLYFVTPLVSGEDLATRLDREGALGRLQVADLVEKLAGALDAVHALGLVHRDVKPGNVLVPREPDGHVLLIDYGIAVSEGVPQAGGYGTPGFAAPEQSVDGAVDRRADVYALAATAISCLDDDALEVFEEIVQRAMSRDVAARYPSAGAFAAALASALRD